MVITVGENNRHYRVFLVEHGQVKFIFLRRIWLLRIAISRPVDSYLQREATACIINRFCCVHPGKAASWALSRQRSVQDEPSRTDEF